MMVGKLLLALLLNAALLAGLGRWLRRERARAPLPQRRLLLPLLALRLLVGGLGGLRLVDDAAYLSGLGRALSGLLWADPAAGLRALLGTSFLFGQVEVTSYGLSNTLFVTKLLALLNLASLGAGWLNGLYLALFAFVGAWQLTRALLALVPEMAVGAPVLSLLLWPSGLLYASGVGKEAVLLGSGMWLLAQVLRVLYPAANDDAAERGLAAPLAAPGPAPGHAGWRVLGAGLGLVGLAGLHFLSRYFFAGVLLAVLGALAATVAAQRLGLARSRLSQTLLLLAVVGAAAGLAPQLSSGYFGENRFTTELIKLYTGHLRASAQKPHFEYADLRPTLGSALRHAPAAAVNTLTRPWLGESRALSYVAAGLENLVLLALLGLAAVAVGRGRAGHLPYALGLALALHCLLLAVLVGLTTPNLGSLHRYRLGMLPYWLLLLLQNDYATRLLARLGLGPAAPPSLVVGC